MSDSRSAFDELADEATEIAGEEPGPEEVAEDANEYETPVQFVTSKVTDYENILKPLAWRVVVRPKEPEEKIGILYRDSESMEADKYLTHLGQIVAMGFAAFRSKTTSGINLGDDPNMPKVGDWVIWPYNAAQRFMLRDGSFLTVLDDTMILAYTERPEDLQFYG